MKIQLENFCLNFLEEDPLLFVTERIIDSKAISGFSERKTMKDQVTYYLTDNQEYVSQYRDKLCWPKSKEQTEFTILPSNYHNLNHLVNKCGGEVTKQIPLEIKNLHRNMHGLKPVKSSTWSR